MSGKIEVCLGLMCPIAKRAKCLRFISFIMPRQRYNDFSCTWKPCKKFIAKTYKINCKNGTCIAVEQ